MKGEQLAEKAVDQIRVCDLPVKRVKGRRWETALRIKESTPERLEAQETNIT